VTTVGIVGGGQLARMMHAASVGLGLRVVLLAEGPDVSAAQVVHDVVVGDYTDLATLAAFAARVDVVTFDHEHVPTSILESLVAGGATVRPGPAALVHAQDKAVMRQRLAVHGANVPAYRVVGSPSALGVRRRGRLAGDRQDHVVATTARAWKVEDAAGARALRGAHPRPGPTEVGPGCRVQTPRVRPARAGSVGDRGPVAARSGRRLPCLGL
jgi:hypothetical protein